MPTRHASAHTPFARFDVDVSPFDDLPEFITGERVCPPGREKSRRGSSWRSSFLTLGILGCAAFAIVKLPADIRASLAARAWSLIEMAFAPTPDFEPAAPQADEPPAALAERQEIAPAAGAGSGTLVTEQPAPAVQEPQAPAETTALPDAAAQSPPEPLPLPVADPADPLQRRALAIGLHPDLSHAVLARLSQDDWRNARRAIDMALAATRDTRAVIWPKIAVGPLAQFEVRFVAASAVDCRRYVVIVTKDRWSTTARAMELCADALKQRRG